MRRPPVVLIAGLMSPQITQALERASPWRCSTAVTIDAVSESFFILTGAPGTGKTAILSRLPAGVPWVAEPARELLAENPALDVRYTWRQDPDVFLGLILARSMRTYEATSGSGPVVFDRGLPDCVAYALQLGADPTPSLAAAERYRYNPEVLIATPWEDIYTTDTERTMTFEMTVQFHHHVVTAYELTGYTLIEVPQGQIAERVAFVAAAVWQSPLGRHRVE